MPTVFSHAATGLAIATVIAVPGALGRLVSAGALAAVFPDLDVVAHWLGVPWGHALGHREISHSLAFAAVLAALLSVTMFRGPGWSGRRGGLWLVLVLATASHGGPGLDDRTAAPASRCSPRSTARGISCPGARSRSRRSARARGGAMAHATSCSGPAPMPCARRRASCRRASRLLR